jgi:Flp pilus assembly protein TadG
MDFLNQRRHDVSRDEKHRERRQRGVASIEMIVVLPVLLLLIFGTIDFGMLFREWFVLHRAADVASRSLLVVDFPCNPGVRIAQATAAGQAMLVGSNVTGTVFLSDGAVCATGNVTMTASSTYRSSVLGVFVPSMTSFPLTARSTQRTNN